MLNRFFGTSTHLYVHLIGLSGIAFALPCSTAVMSISMMLLVLNLLLEADFSNYWKRIKSNQLYVLLFFFMFLHVVGIVWSSNIDYALNDLRSKLPLLIIPTALAVKPITNKKYLHIILGVFLASMLVTSIYNYIAYQQWLGYRFYDDIRGMSIFSSHIRYSLLITMAAAISIYFLHKGNKKLAPLLILFVGWFGYYTFYSQIMSGFLAFSGMAFVYCIYQLWQWKRPLAYFFSITCFLAGTLLLVWLFQSLSVNPNDYNDLAQKTAEGNLYTHNFDFVSSETEEPIYINVCEQELEREWNKRSDIKYETGTDVKGNQIRHTLIRYLSSLGLTKDAVGVKALSELDMHNIQNGCPSKNHSGIMPRLHGIRFELNYSNDPNGHSLLQRLEYWKAGISITQQNWFLGVGTGDVQTTFDQHYEKNNSLLITKNRRRAHNMFLTFWLTFGLLGIILFIAVIVKYTIHYTRLNQLLPLLFITIAVLSFLVEDTLETQTGVTFFALFYALFFQDNTPSSNSLSIPTK